MLIINHPFDQIELKMKIRDSVRIVFIGDASVGKTSIISQFIDGYFNQNYKPTVEDFHTHTVQLKSK